MKRKDNLIVGLDIGTSKVCAIVGEEIEEGRVDIIGIGQVPSTGLRKGVVINIEATVSAIEQAIDEAERMAGCEIGAVYAGIGGGHIKSLNSHGIVAVKDREVTAQDVIRVLDAAQTIAIPGDRELIHIIPQEYIIDDQEGIRDPQGMSGVRLAAKVHIVTSAQTSAQNIVKCCEKTGLYVRDLVLNLLAAADAVLTEDEKELGVLIVDIGGGTTDMAVYASGSVQHTAVIPVGGDHITRDIAIGLGTPTADAEQIKKQYGCASTQLLEGDETVEIPGVGGRKRRPVSRRMLAEIIEPRVEEMLSLVTSELERSGLEDMLPAGVVITGGSTELHGMPEMAERVFGMSVRKGVPAGVGGLLDEIGSPAFAAPVGLVLFGAFKGRDGDPRQTGRENFYRRMKNRMEEWIGNIF